MSSLKKATICSVCIALCCILPIAFHAMALGTAFSPMHIPVLLCGLVCGWPYGAFCGIAGPILSSLVTGMPGSAMLIYMVPELLGYGLTAGLLMKLIHTKNTCADLYISLAAAMLLGRVAGGAARAVFYTGGQPYSIALWASAYFVQSLPGIILHLVIIPLLVLVLTKAKLIPARYGTKAAAQ